MSVPFIHRHRVASALSACILLAVLWAALVPVRQATRDRLFEIPTGTAARTAAGETTRMLPSVVRLTLGVQDVLLLKNSDDVAHVFGPVRILPGQEFRMPLEQAGDYAVACSANPRGEITLEVLPRPDPGWQRLRWRLGALVHAIRYLPVTRG